MALHKMIRLITAATSGNGYLCFMGNEFGHPEWIDFPREGNQWSYDYARRQWSLSENPNLRYHHLLNFHKAVIKIVNDFNIYSKQAVFLQEDKSNQILSFERNGLLFIFNFNPNNSYPDYGIRASKEKYKLLFHSDKQEFGGFERIAEHQEFIRMDYHYLKIYIPNRSVLILH
jgi:1,4-alpha-glucan branching enzyme